MPANRRLSEFFFTKKLALLRCRACVIQKSNTILSSRSALWATRGLQVLRSTTKEGRQLFLRKSVPSQLLCPPILPNVKSWLRACINYITANTHDKITDRESDVGAVLRCHRSSSWSIQKCAATRHTSQTCWRRAILHRSAHSRALCTHMQNKLIENKKKSILNHNVPGE